MPRKPDSKHAILLLAAALLVLNVYIPLRVFLTHPGLVFYRDLHWPLDSSYFYTIARSTWDPFLEQQSFPFQAPLHLLLSLLPPGAGERLIYILVFSLMTLSPFILVYKLTSSPMAAALSSILYVYNPVVANRVQHKFLLLGYSLLPLAVLAALRLASWVEEGGSARRLVWAALPAAIITTVAGHGLHFYFYTLLTVYLYTSTRVVLAEGRRLKRLLPRLALALACYTALTLAASAYYVAPMLYTALHGEGPGYTLSLDLVNLLSRNSSPQRVARLEGYWYPTLAARAGEQRAWLHSVYPLAALASLPLLLVARLSRRRLPPHYTWLLTSTLPLAVASFVLACGTQLLGETYARLVLEAPLGWLLRDPYKHAFLLAFSYSLLAGLAAGYMDKYLGRRTPGRLVAAALTAAAAAAAVAGNPGLTSGNMASAFTPVKVEPLLATGWASGLGLQVYPSTPGTPLPWIENSRQAGQRPLQVYAYTMAVNLGDSKAFLAASLGADYCYTGLRSRLLPGEEDSLALRKGIVNVPDFSKLLHLVKARRIGSNRLATVYQLPGCNNSLVYPATTAYFGAGFEPLAVLARLGVLGNNSVYIPLDTVAWRSVLKTISTEASAVIVSPEPGPWLLEAKNAIVISLYRATLRDAPGKYWSRARSGSGAVGDLWGKLANRKLYAWFFDYGRGVAYTWADNANTSIAFTVNKAGVYTVLARLARLPRGGSVEISIDNTWRTSVITSSAGGGGSIEWLRLGAVRLAKGHHILMVSGRGANAVNLVVLIPTRDAVEAVKAYIDTLAKHPLLLVYEAEDVTVTGGAAAGSPHYSSGQAVLVPAGRSAVLRLTVPVRAEYTIAIAGRGYGDLFVGCIEKSNFHLAADQPIEVVKTQLEPGTVLVKIRSRVKWSKPRGLGTLCSTRKTLAIGEGEAVRVVFNVTNTGRRGILRVALLEPTGRVLDERRLTINTTGLYTVSIPGHPAATHVLVESRSACSNVSLQTARPLTLDYIMLKHGDATPPRGDISLRVVEAKPWRVVVEAEADTPFILVFRQAYSRFWRARIEAGGRTWWADSIPVYGYLNGFPVNATGRLRVVIVYTVQKYYTLGTAVSVLTLLATAIAAYQPREWGELIAGLQDRLRERWRAWRRLVGSVGKRGTQQSQYQ